MRRLIDANALSEKIGNMKFEITNNRGGYKYCNEDEKNEWDKLDSFDSLVCDAPTVDAVEVVHGNNVSKMHPVDEFICSNCGVILREWCEVRIDEENEDECYYEFEFSYCPKCGMKITKEIDAVTQAARIVCPMCDEDFCVGRNRCKEIAGFLEAKMDGDGNV